MKLTAKEIFALSHGAVRYEKGADGRVALRRFTERSKAFYDRTNQDFAKKTRGGSCIRLEFDTDADEFTLAYEAEKISSRFFCFFDVTLDGVLVAHPGKENTTELAGEISLALPAGTHRVAIYFPALFDAQITALTFPDGATVTPVAKSCKLFCIGDSITQGYDAEYPSQSYANLLTDKLNATAVNYAIGGEVFNPDLLDAEMPFSPDVITVAYGTNDWSKCERADMVKNAGELYRRLRETYPAAKIFALTPIWRADKTKSTKVGTFEEAVEIVKAAATAQEGVIVIDGDKLVPHLAEVFSDKYLHPNDFGFKFYAEALYAAMLPHLA